MLVPTAQSRVRHARSATRYRSSQATSWRLRRRLAGARRGLVRDMDGARTCSTESAPMAAPPCSPETRPREDGAGRTHGQGGRSLSPRARPSGGKPPAPGALRLMDLWGSGPVLALAIGCSWTLGWSSAWRMWPRISGCGETRSGRVLFAGWGELRQVTEGGAERVLARRNERDRLIAESEQAVAGEHAAARRSSRRSSRHERPTRRATRPMGRCATASASWARRPRLSAKRRG